MSEPLDGIGNSELRARDPMLALLWHRGTLPQTISLTLPHRFTHQLQDIASWQVILIFEVAEPGSEHAQCLSAVELVQTVKEMLSLGQQIADAVGSQPAYVIVHVWELDMQGKKQRDENRAKNQEKVLIQVLQRQLATMLPTNDEKLSLSAFDHYDRKGHYGWLTFTLGWALLVGVERGEVRVLANILQPYDTIPQHRGIAPERYTQVLERIVLWNTSRDLFEASSRVRTLIESGTSATKGQLWLTFALTAIGTLLALFSLPNVASLVGGRLALPLILFALSSLCHAQYAALGRRWSYTLGIAIFVGAVAASIIVFLPALLPLLKV